MGHGWPPAGAGAAQGNEMDALMGRTESERQSDLGSWNAPGHFVLKLKQLLIGTSGQTTWVYQATRVQVTSRVTHPVLVMLCPQLDL